MLQKLASCAKNYASKLKGFLLFVTLVISQLSYAQSNKSFQNLKALTIGKGNSGYAIIARIDASNSTIYNTTIDSISPENINGFTYEDIECERSATIIASTMLNNNRKVLLTYGTCPEFEFFIYDYHSKKLIHSFSAFEIIIPGNNAIYTSGHLGEFNLKRKSMYLKMVPSENLTNHSTT